nr:MAG TPA: hypothetical protein [Caudoviricetes sp.]
MPYFCKISCIIGGLPLILKPLCNGLCVYKKYTNKPTIFIGL